MKGDAIAGLIIIFVNILGGVTIGVTQKGLSAADALQLYSILTVGDGMVSQVPALLIAITAGIIVTRVSSEESSDLGTDIGAQVVAQPKALLIGGLLLVLFGLIPGFPMITFFTLAAIVTAGGYFIGLRQRKELHSNSQDLPTVLAQGAGAPAARSKPKPGGKPRGKLGEKEEFAMTVPLLIDVDAALQVDLEAIALNDELVRVRRALYLDLGVPFPGIHLRFNEGMGPGEYLIQLQEVPVARGLLRPGHQLVQESASQLDLLGVPAQPGGHAAHGSQVGQQRHAGEVLQHHARDDERDFVLAVCVGRPVRQLLDMLGRDLAAIAVAQHRFEHDADRHRQALDLWKLFGQRGQRVELAVFARRCPEALEGVGKRVAGGLGRRLA